MSQFWPRYTPSLPMGDAPQDDVSVGYIIRFKAARYGKIIAFVYDDFGSLIDKIFGVDFQDAYDTVREAYPQASWKNNAD